ARHPDVPGPAALRAPPVSAAARPPPPSVLPPARAGRSPPGGRGLPGDLGRASSSGWPARADRGRGPRHGVSGYGSPAQDFSRGGRVRDAPAPTSFPRSATHGATALRLPDNARAPHERTIDWYTRSLHGDVPSLRMSPTPPAPAGTALRPRHSVPA